MNPTIAESADPAAPARFAQSLHATGFAILHMSDHMAAMADGICQEWLAFFGTSDKYRYLSEPGGQDGYFPHLPDDASSGRDRKEYFHVRAAGSYPAEVSDAAQHFFAAASELGTELLGWLQAELPGSIATGLSMQLPAMMTGSVGSLLRIQHYLPLNGPDQWTPVRAAPHRDLNLLTLLPVPTHPGLQIRDPSGAWRDVPNEPGVVVINAGLMLDRATQGYYPAVEHRVISPALEDGVSSRISLPVFLQPRANVPLDGEVTASALLRRQVGELRERGWRPVPGGQ